MDKKFIKEIKQFCSHEGYDFKEHDIAYIIETYEKLAFEKISSGEDFKLRGIGVIKTQPFTVKSNLHEGQEYETVKFFFNASANIKKAARQKIAHLLQRKV